MVLVPPEDVDFDAWLEKQRWVVANGLIPLLPRSIYLPKPAYQGYDARTVEMPEGREGSTDPWRR